MQITDEVKGKYIQNEIFEAANKAVEDRKKRHCKDKPPAKKGSGNQAPSSVPTNARGAFRAPDDGC